ncbi:hypothetical protein D3C76_1648490 [compost metagenome]
MALTELCLEPGLIACDACDILVPVDLLADGRHIVRAWEFVLFIEFIEFEGTKDVLIDN